MHVTHKPLLCCLQKSVYHTALGQDIQRDANVVYVSWDDRCTWIALHDFAHQVRHCDSRAMMVTFANCHR